MAVQIKIRIILPLTKKKNTKNRQSRKHLSVQSQKQDLRKSGEICPKLTMKIPERPHYYL